MALGNKENPPQNFEKPPVVTIDQLIEDPEFLGKKRTELQRRFAVAAAKVLSEEAAVLALIDELTEERDQEG
jgi:hypothetical protein